MVDIRVVLPYEPVTPVHAGIYSKTVNLWIPASAGMTGRADYVIRITIAKVEINDKMLGSKIWRK